MQDLQESQYLFGSVLFLNFENFTAFPMALFLCWVVDCRALRYVLVLVTISVDRPSRPLRFAA
jgi:hypothetical protein